jgi:hypothetical protein
LVEHATENRSVAGSIPALGTILFIEEFLVFWPGKLAAFRLTFRATFRPYSAAAPCLPLGIAAHAPLAKSRRRRHTRAHGDVAERLKALVC